MFVYILSPESRNPESWRMRPIRPGQDPFRRQFGRFIHALLPLAEEEVSRRPFKDYIDAATCLRDKLLIRLLARLGCRVSEAPALTVDDIDFQQSTVRIEHLKSRIRLVCTNCNARLDKSHSFCPRCGKAVDKTVTEEKEYRLKKLQEAREVLQREKLRSQEGKEIYKKRLYTVEPVLGNMKWNRRRLMMSLRGVEKVRAEFLLMCLVHNVKKIARRVLEGSLLWFGWHKASQVALSGYKLEDMALVGVQV